MIVATDNLSKEYDGVYRVQELDIRIKEGDIYGFLGPNGAGKSTTMKMLLGLVKPTSGTIEIMGKPFNEKNLRDILASVGSLIESPSYYGHLTGRENMEIIRRLLDLPKKNIEEAVHIVRMENQMEKKVKNYSLGMKQRLGIAMALARFPKLLILDEPTNGLDPIGIAEVRNFIKDLSVDRGKTILISSHILSEIALLADDIGIIDHGVLLEESSMEDLEKKNRKYIQLQVSDVPKASLILERQFHVTDYAVQDEHSLRLYDTALDMAAINKALVVQDVAVISSQICNDTLEDYFKQITGGEGIA